MGLQVDKLQQQAAPKQQQAAPKQQQQQAQEQAPEEQQQQQQERSNSSAAPKYKGQDVVSYKTRRGWCSAGICRKQSGCMAAVG